MNGSGGPPKSGEDLTAAALLNTLREIQEERKQDRAEMRELRELVGSMAINQQAHAAPPPPAPAPAQSEGSLVAMLLQSQADTNQLLMGKLLENKAPPPPVAPMDPFSSPAVMRFLDLQKELVEAKLGGGGVTAVPTDSLTGKVQSKVSQLVEKSIEDALEGRTGGSDEDPGILKTFLDIAERTGSIDKIVEAASDRIKGSGEEKEEKRERKPLGRPNVPPPRENRPRQPKREKLPPEPEPEQLPDEAGGETIAPADVRSAEDLLVATAAAIRDNMPAEHFVDELPTEAKNILRSFPEAKVIEVLRSMNVPILKSIRARQWVQAAYQHL